MQDSYSSKLELQLLNLKLFIVILLSVIKIKLVGTYLIWIKIIFNKSS